jgi:sulfur relay (sulfurtransferase) DsrF/TusC family protein
LAKQSTLVVVRRSPLAVEAAEEGLRIAVGLTLAVAEVAVLLVDEAVALAAPTLVSGPRKDAYRHWQTLGELGVRRMIERESLADHGLAIPSTAGGIEVVARGEVAPLLADAESVVVF